MKTLAIGVAAIAALIATDWQTSIARAQAQGGTNTRSGSYTRGAHVYCGSDNPYVFCKPPGQTAPINPNTLKRKSPAGRDGRPGGDGRLACDDRDEARPYVT